MSGDPDRSALRRTLFVAAVSLAVATVVTLFGPTVVLPHGPGHGGGPPIPDTLVQVKLFVSTYNVVALAFLAGAYGMLYRELPNRFTLSLLLFTAALLLYALTSNPLTAILLGFRGSGLGPFTFLPDLFAALAVTFLTYQSSA